LHLQEVGRGRTKRQSEGETLADILRGLTDGLGSAASTAASSAPQGSVTATASVSIPALTPGFLSAAPLAPELDLPAAHTPSPSASRLGSPAPSQLSINISITVSPTSTLSHITVASPVQAVRKPPSLEEFLADIECRRARQQRPLGDFRDPNELASALAETGQENDSADLIEARNIALATTGQWADYSPTFAWNFLFGDKTAAYREMMDRNAAKAEGWLQGASTKPPKRAAAVAASGAWMELTPRTRRRLQ
jgi:hypothetical protein